MEVHLMPPRSNHDLQAQFSDAKAKGYDYLVLHTSISDSGFVGDAATAARKATLKEDLVQSTTFPMAISVDGALNLTLSYSDALTHQQTTLTEDDLAQITQAKQEIADRKAAEPSGQSRRIRRPWSR